MKISHGTRVTIRVLITLCILVLCIGVAPWGIGTLLDPDNNPVLRWVGGFGVLIVVVAFVWVVGVVAVILFVGVYQFVKGNIL